MEYLEEKIGDNVKRVIEYLDYESYINIIDSEIINMRNMEIIKQVNNYLLKRQESKLYEYRKEYYARYSVGYDKLDIAWKENREYWKLVENEGKEYREECKFNKYYRLNYVWWFDVSNTFNNMRGRYRFILKMRKGNLELINYVIKKNNVIIKQNRIELNEIEEDRNIEIRTEYIECEEDEIYIRFYETDMCKNNIEIYGIEYI
jgi:hypothetical protein